MIRYFSPGFKKYFTNTSWLLGERILRMGVALFVGIYVARYLGPAQFGLLSFSTSFVGIFLALATLGLDGIVVRELVKSPHRREELLGTAFVLKLVGTVLMWIGILAVIPLTQNDDETNMLIAIIAFAVVFQAFNVIDFHYQAGVQSRYVVNAQLVQLILSSVTKVAFVLLEAPLIWFAWVYLFDAVVLAAGLAVMYMLTSGTLWRWRYRHRIAVELLKDSWPLIFSGVMISIYMRIDQVMIKEMLGAKDVGSYAAAVKISEAWYFIPIAITASLFPAIINAKEQTELLYQQRLQKLYDLMVWLAVVIAVPVTLFSHWIIEALYGQEYLDAAEVLVIHVWAGVFVFLNNAAWKWHTAENNVVYANVRLFAGLLLNLLLNLLLIPMYGIEGAAIATILSRGMASYLGNVFFKETRLLFFQQTKALVFLSFFRRTWQVLSVNRKEA